MSDNIKVITLSKFTLPHERFGSWTNMYMNYLNDHDHRIDAIICPELKLKPYPEVKYSFFKKSITYKLKKKIYKNRFYHVIHALDSLLKKFSKEDKFVLQIIDDQGIVPFVVNYLKKAKIRHKFYLQFFFHGHLLNRTQDFFNSIDELVLLTKKSYQLHTEKYHNLSPYVSVLPNGINTNIFRGANNKKTSNVVFLWCSQDRPKKGLHLILEIWSRFHEYYPNTILKIVGTHKTYHGEGVKCLGRIPNDHLPEIYQSANVYLFPTLCHEGFGLTLAEALHCGCFCIASKIGGVPEVLNHGEYGWLINEPHNEEEWLNAMVKYMKEQPQHPKVPKDKFSLELWSKGMNEIINKAKNRMKNKG